MKRVSAIVKIIFFLAAIAVPPLLIPIVSSNEVSSAEKRELAAFPEISVSNITSFPRGFDDYLNDHLPFRDELIKGYNSVLYNALATSATPDVIIGKDGWLFYNRITDGDPIATYKGEDLFTEDELFTIANQLQSASDTLKAEGREFVILIAPNKERVYSEFMPDYLGPPSDEYTVKQLCDYLREHTDVRVVNTYDGIMPLKDNSDPTRDIFYKGDTHWRHYGAYIASWMLLNSLGIEIPHPQDVELYPAEALLSDSDLSMMLHLENEMAEPIYLVSHDSYDTTSVEFLGEENGARYHTENAPGGRLFVIQDSFYNYMRGYMAAQFTDTLSQGVIYDPVAQAVPIREFDPDVVVYETSERRLKEIINWGYE